MHNNASHDEIVTKAVIGEPEVVERRTGHVPKDAAAPADRARTVEMSDAWRLLKTAVLDIRALQDHDGSIPDVANHTAARQHAAEIVTGIHALAPVFPHDAEYLAASVADFERWAAEGFGVPDFYDSLVAFQPQRQREDGIRHLVIFPMYTQNGSPDRLIEALIVETIWPGFIAELEAGDYGNKLFVSLRLVDFTPGYDSNSAVLFPETVSVREVPTFTWGAIFQDREAARYRRVVRAASDITKLDLPSDAARMLDDPRLAEHTFVMWDLIHDRTHMRGDLPFDPFMIKQRMPYFLYSLEELRCDLTAFRESVALHKRLSERLEAEGPESLTANEKLMHEHAALVQYTVIFDRVFRFAITGSRVRNYDGLGGQLLFAWLHQAGVLHWTNTQLTFDWPAVADAVIALGERIDDLYWRSIDRPKVAHWLAAYELIRAVLTPHPASVWARGLPDEVLAGPPSGYTDAVLPDEFPLSMFFEALEKKMRPVIESTSGIRGGDA